MFERFSKPPINISVEKVMARILYSTLFLYDAIVKADGLDVESLSEFKIDEPCHGLLQVAAVFEPKERRSEESAANVVSSLLFNRAVLLGRDNRMAKNREDEHTPDPDYVLLGPSLFRWRGGFSSSDYYFTYRMRGEKRHTATVFDAAQLADLAARHSQVPIVGEEVINGEVKLIQGNKRPGRTYHRVSVNPKVEQYEKVIEEVRFSSARDYYVAVKRLTEAIPLQEATAEYQYHVRELRAVKPEF